MILVISCIFSMFLMVDQKKLTEKAWMPGCCLLLTGRKQKSPPVSRKGQFLAHGNWLLPSDLSASDKSETELAP
jgi:hypothetical protein